MALQNLLNQTISLYNKSSFDEYGRESYGSATSYSARMQLINKTILQPNGQVEQIDAIAYISGEPTVNVSDKITYSSQDYRVHGVEKGHDGQGNVHHTKVILQRWGA